MRDLDPSQFGQAGRREFDPPIQVETATWSKAGQLDLVGEGTSAVARPGTRQGRPSTMDQSC